MLPAVSSLVSGFALLLVLVGVCAQAAEVSFELYQRIDGQRVLLGKGTKIYESADFSIRREERDGKFYAVRKELALFDGYSIGFSDTQDRNVSGFGLRVGHLPFDSNSQDFSWEWYDRQENGLYCKRQGGSRVKATFAGLPVMQELRTVEFLDDVEFRYIEDLCCKPKDDGPTHILVIRAGSVLVFPHGN